MSTTFNFTDDSLRVSVFRIDPMEVRGSETGSETDFVIGEAKNAFINAALEIGVINDGDLLTGDVDVIVELAQHQHGGDPYTPHPVTVEWRSNAHYFWPVVEGEMVLR